MDENSCKDETSESVDGQKEKEAENATELEKAGAKINSEVKRKLNQDSDHRRPSFDDSGPSTHFFPVKDENARNEKVNKQTANVALVQDHETGSGKMTEQKKCRPDENEPHFSSASREENRPELKEPSAPTEDVQYPKIPLERDEESASTSVAIGAIPPGYDIQPRVRLAPGVEEELSTRRPSVGPPPSYSFVMKQKKKIKLVPSIDPLLTDIPPPPTYAGSRTIYLSPEERVCSFPSFAEPMWRSHSQPALCPRCGIIVLTTTHTHDSKATHVAALALCLLGCWPCCLLPYCLNVCKNTYHHCPICQTFLGLCRPW